MAISSISWLGIAWRNITVYFSHSYHSDSSNQILIWTRSQSWIMSSMGEEKSTFKNKEKA